MPVDGCQRVDHALVRFAVALPQRQAVPLPFVKPGERGVGQQFVTIQGVSLLVEWQGLLGRTLLGRFAEGGEALHVRADVPRV